MDDKNGDQSTEDGPYSKPLKTSPLKGPWFRSADGPIAGVCAGLAEKFEIDVMLVRLIWLFSFLIYGFGLCLYIILAIALPRSDRLAEANQPKLLGVCVRFAKRFDLDVGLTRVGFLFLFFSSLGLVGMFYLILNFVLPKSESSTSRSDF